MYLSKKFLVFVSIFLGVIFACAGSINADGGRKLIPSITILEEYNDNIFMTAIDETDDVISTVSPGLELVEKTERLDASIKGLIDALAYSDNDELNAVDQRYFGRFRYMLTPLMGVSAEAQYIKDSRSDREIEESGLVLGTQTREREHYLIGGDWTLSEKTAVGINYSYDDENNDDPGSNDYYTHVVGLGLTHNLSSLISRTVGRMNFGYGRYEFTNSTVDSYSLTTGAERELSEIFSFLVDVGPRFTRTEYGTTNQLSEENWGVAGNVSLTYKGEVSDASLTLSEDVRPASGTNGTTERTALAFNVSRRFSEELRGSFLARYFRNKSDTDIITVQETNQENYRIQPRLHYAFTKDITLEASYAYTFIKDKVADNDRERNSVFLRLYFQYPLFE